MALRQYLKYGWECECDEHYIQPITVEQCAECDFLKVDAPDARQEDTDTYRKWLGNTTPAYRQLVNGLLPEGPAILG